MIRAAFYAPMKPPGDPVPSGDREIARGLIAALAKADVQPEIVSEFRSRDGQGDPDFQTRKIEEAEAKVKNLVALGREQRWDLWITYHNYYKAPDLLGPSVAKLLDIPYIQIESTRARKRLSGPWALFAKAAEKASDSASAIFYMTQRDAEALDAYKPENQVLVSLPPFLAQEELPPESKRDKSRLLSVGMMRSGDKLASYALIAQTLTLLTRTDWQLDIAGDGPERARVEAMMAPFGTRVRFLGALDATKLQHAYARSSIFLWPGVNEAFGVAYLEAQAAGLAVVAQNRPGVKDVLFPGGVYPVPEDGASAIAARLSFLLDMPKLTMHIGQAARAHVETNHLLGSASARLRDAISEVQA